VQRSGTDSFTSFSLLTMTQSIGPATNGERLHALDAIRAIALLLGIVLHGALSFLHVSVAEWPVTDEQVSTTLAMSTFVIHIFRMSVFFVVAGFFARLLLERRGLKEFCRNRWQRIALPLILGWPVCFVAVVAVVVWVFGRGSGAEGPTLPPEVEQAGPNFMHLWFLYLLLWLYAIALALRAVLHRRAQWLALADRCMGALIRSRVGALALASPIALALSLIPGWGVHLGIPTPGYTLIPPAAPLFIYAYVFMLGWMLHRQRELLAALTAARRTNAIIGVLAAAVSIVAMAQSRLVFSNGVTEGPSEGVGAFAYATAIVGLSWAFLGYGLKWFSKESPVMRYLSDASY
jgi:glucans biosynthesis protein C